MAVGVRDAADANVVVGVNVFAGVKTGVEKDEPISGSMDDVGTTCAMEELVAVSSTSSTDAVNADNMDERDRIVGCVVWCGGDEEVDAFEFERCDR